VGVGSANLNESSGLREALQGTADEEIRSCIAELLQIVDRLRCAYPKKRFTLDGRLVGDLGEALVERDYELRVFDDMQRHHDAVTPDGKLVQIKATMKESLSFPADHIPDYYIGVRIRPDGSLEKIFNGPGDVAAQAVAVRSHPKTNLHSISLSALRSLDATVLDEQRIPRRRDFSERQTN
jgi:hypothetical protein